jgi:glycosyltransferase involved in cell wall biosynthesis
MNESGAQRLGICIPVYRRPALLKLCLRAAVRSARAANVPIFISDDSGDDTNAAVITAAQSDYPLIHWHRNPVNLGIDRNILCAASLCRPDYAWLMGEDDLILPEGVSRVLDILSRSSPGFVFVNYSYVSNDYKYRLKERVVSVMSDKEIPASEFIERYAWAIGFIGACVLDRRSWNPQERFLDTYYAHVGSILANLRIPRIALIAEPLVLNRAENTKSFTWSAHAFDVFFGWERMLRMLHGTSGQFDLESALQSSRTLFRHTSILWLVSKRADGIYGLDTYRRFVKPSATSAVQRFLGLLVAVCPRAICMAAKFLARDLPRRLRRTALTLDAGQ